MKHSKNEKVPVRMKLEKKSSNVAHLILNMQLPLFSGDASFITFSQKISKRIKSPENKQKRTQKP